MLDSGGSIFTVEKIKIWTIKIRDISFFAVIYHGLLAVKLGLDVN